MASASFHSLFEIQHSPSTSDNISSPPATLQKGRVQAPTAIELDDYVFGKRYNGPDSLPQTPMEGRSGTQDPVEQFMPKSPNELESSRPSSPKREEAASLVQSWNNPPMNKWRVLSCCVIYLGNGINDSGMLSLAL